MDPMGNELIHKKLTKKITKTLHLGTLVKTNRSKPRPIQISWQKQYPPEVEHGPCKSYLPNRK